MQRDSITREQFTAYQRVLTSGGINMFFHHRVVAATVKNVEQDRAERGDASTAVGLSMRDVGIIQRDYSYLRDKFTVLSVTTGEPETSGEG